MFGMEKSSSGLLLYSCKDISLLAETGRQSVHFFINADYSHMFYHPPECLLVNETLEMLIPWFDV